MKNTNPNVHILIADDEHLICDILKYGLESRGYGVSIVHNGLEALNILAEKDFDMVLMDIKMPIMDGLTATKFLRKCEQGEHRSLTENHDLAQSLHSRRKGERIPVLAITGNIRDQEIALQIGMDAVLPKPFRLSVIYDVLSQFCEKSTEDSFAERRRYLRHAIKNDTVVALNGHIGQVVDISNGGLAIKYAKHELISSEWSVSVLNTVEKTSTPYLPLKLVRGGDMEVSSSSGVETQTIGAMFNNLDVSQKTYIRQFIYNLA